MSVWAGDGEPSDVWHEITRKARKKHVCCACKETIESGHNYVIITSIYDRRVEKWKRCVRCEAMWEKLNIMMQRQPCNEETPDMELDCGHSYEDRWNESPSKEMAELAFLIPGEAPGDLIGQRE